jgi:type IV pilus assembly protein PilF
MRKDMKKIWLVGAGCLLVISILFSCTSKNLEDQNRKAEAYRRVGEEYIRIGKFRLALKELQKAESLSPDNYFLQDDLGLVYYFLDKQDMAIDHFKKALALKGDYASARNNLGNAYMQKGEWDKAIEQYEMVISNLLFAQPHKPLSNLGMAYYQKKDYRLAEKYFLEALDIRKDFSAALYGLGKTYMAMGRGTEAVTRLERAAIQAPDVARVHFELGKAYTMNREYKKAYDAYQEVVRLDTGSPLADRALKEAQRIKDLF